MNRDDGELSPSAGAGQSLQQALAEVRDVEISFWSACTAPTALKCQFAAVPDEGVIAIVSAAINGRHPEEIEGLLLLSTSWKILQRVLLEERIVAVLFIPDGEPGFSY